MRRAPHRPFFPVSPRTGGLVMIHRFFAVASLPGIVAVMTALNVAAFALPASDRILAD